MSHYVLNFPTDWWAVGASMAVAALTGGLAVATFLMARATRSEVRLERRRMDEAQRPHVYPQTLQEWLDNTGRYQHNWQNVIPVTNAGPGIALNVRGRFRLSNSIFMTLLPTSIHPAQTLDLRIDWGGNNPILEGWADAHGYLLYEDASGASWRSDFYIRESNQRRWFEFAGDMPVSSDHEPDAEFGIVYGPGARPLLGPASPSGR